jgi:hypothetical protein
MTIITAWLLLSVGCSTGFVAGSLFASGQLGFSPP